MSCLLSLALSQPWESDATFDCEDFAHALNTLELLAGGDTYQLTTFVDSTDQIRMFQGTECKRVNLSTPTSSRRRVLVATDRAERKSSRQVTLLESAAKSRLTSGSKAEAKQTLTTDDIKQLLSFDLLTLSQIANSTGAADEDTWLYAADYFCNFDLLPFWFNPGNFPNSGNSTTDDEASRAQYLRDAQDFYVNTVWDIIQTVDPDCDPDQYYDV